MDDVTHDFEGNTVVTGGSSGIGRETALRFAEAGARSTVTSLGEGPHTTVSARSVRTSESSGMSATISTPPTVGNTGDGR